MVAVNQCKFPPTDGHLTRRVRCAVCLRPAFAPPRPTTTPSHTHTTADRWPTSHTRCSWRPSATALGRCKGACSVRLPHRRPHRRRHRRCRGLATEPPSGSRWLCRRRRRRCPGATGFPKLPELHRRLLSQWHHHHRPGRPSNSALELWLRPSPSPCTTMKSIGYDATRPPSTCSRAASAATCSANPSRCCVATRTASLARRLGSSANTSARSAALRSRERSHSAAAEQPRGSTLCCAARSI